MADFKQLQEENQQPFNPYKTNPDNMDFSAFTPEKFNIKNVEQGIAGMPKASNIDVSKYEKYLGSTLDIYPDLNEARAKAQSGWKLLGNALGQSLTEATVGTIQGFGYLAQAPVTVYHLLRGQQDDFENFWTKSFGDLKNNIDNKWFPIYLTKAAQEGKIFDATSMASNLKNIVTSVSLMIPAFGAARGFAQLGRVGRELRVGARVAKGMSQADALAKEAKIADVLGAVGAGITSRSAESVMEANQQVQQSSQQWRQKLAPEYMAEAERKIQQLPMVMPYEEGKANYTIDDYNRDKAQILEDSKAAMDAEIKQHVSNEAANVFKTNMALSVVDALQFAPFMKSFEALKDASKVYKYGVLPFEAVSEAGEEIYQQGAQDEAHWAEENHKKFLGPGFSERFAEYLKDDQTKLAGFWGAVGGGFFKAVGPITKKVTDKYTDFNVKRSLAASTKNPEAFTKLTDDARADLIVNNIKQNNLDGLSTSISALENMYDNADWNTIGTNEEEAKATLSGFKDDIAQASELKTDLDANPVFKGNDLAKLDYIRTALTSKNNEKLIKSTENSVNEIYKTLIKNNEVKPEFQELHNLSLNIQALKNLKKNLSQIPSFKKDGTLRREAVKSIDNKIKVAQEMYNSSAESIKKTNPDINLQDELATTKNNEIVDKLSKAAELELVQNKVVKPKLTNYALAQVKGDMDMVNKELTKQQDKATKESIKDQVANAKTTDELQAAADVAVNEDQSSSTEQQPNNESTNTYNNAVENQAKEDEVTATNDLNTRYDNKPALFRKEQSDLINHISNSYIKNNKQIPKDVRDVVDDLINTNDPKEFAETLQFINQSIDPDIQELASAVNDFFTNRIENIQNTAKARQIQLDNETPVAEYPAVGKNSSDSYTILGDTRNSTFSKYQPFGAKLTHYAMTEVDGKWYIKYDKATGEPMINPIIKNMGIDFEYLSQGNVKVGDEVGFLVNLDNLHDPYHKNLRKKTNDEFVDGFQILIYHKDSNGKTHIVNGLAVVKEDSSNQEEIDTLRTLRHEIFDYIASTGKKKGTVTTNIFTKVEGTHKGRIVRIDKSKSNPHTILREGEPLVLAVAVQKGDAVVIEAGPNAPEGYRESFRTTKDQIGGVFQLVKSGNGVIPARCFTEKLENIPELLSEAVDILRNVNKENWPDQVKKLRKIAYFDINYNPEEDTFTVRRKSGAGVTIGHYTKDNIEDLLRPAIVQVSKNEINTGNYNQQISEQGRLSVDLKPQDYVDNVRFDINPNYYEAGENTSKEIKNTKAKATTEPVVTTDTVKEPTKKVAAPKEPKKLVSNEPVESTDFNYKEYQKKLGAYFNQLSDNDKRIHIDSLVAFGKTTSLEELKTMLADGKFGKPVADLLTKALEENPIEVKEAAKPKRLSKNPLGKINTKRDIPGSKAKLADNYSKLQTKADRAKELNWLKKVLPQVEVGELNTIYDEIHQELTEIYKNGDLEAWGIFKNGMIYLANSVGVGTTYHESFHAVFNLFLDGKTQSSLLEEARNKYFKGDKSKTDLQLEEKLADEFMDYKLQGEQISGLSNKIKSFFKRLHKYIKYKLFNSTNIDNIFYNIDAGFYKGKKVDPIIAKQIETKFLVPGFKPYEQDRRVLSLTDRYSLALDSIRESNPEFANYSTKDLIQLLNDQFGEAGLDVLSRSVYNSLLDDIDSGEINGEKITPEIGNKLNKLVDNFLTEDSEGNIVYKELGKKAIKRFADVEGLRLNITNKELSSYTDIPEDEDVDVEYNSDEGETKLDGWQIKVQYMSGKASLSKEVRRELSYIPKLNKDGSIQKDDLGFYIYQDFNDLYGYLKRELADIYHSGDMINGLERIVKNKPYLQSLLNKVMQDNLFKTKFFVDFCKAHVDYKSVIQNNGQFSVISSNRVSSKNLLVDEWKNNSYDSTTNKLLNKDGSYNSDKIFKLGEDWRQLQDRFKAKNEYNESDLNDLNNILNSFGFTTTIDDLKSINTEFTTSNGKIITGKSKIDNLIKEANLVVSRLENGNNPFESYSNEAQAINNIASIIAANRFDLMESSFRNAENKTVYSHQVPNFLQQKIAELRGENYEEAISYYTDTKFYENSPWLSELLTSEEARNNLEYLEIDGIRYEGAKRGTRFTQMSDKDYDTTAFYMFYNNGSNRFAYYRTVINSDAPRMTFIKFRKYSNEEVVDKLYNVYQQEWARIQDVKERNKVIKDGNLIRITNYDSEKSQLFLMLPFLNKGKGREAVKSEDPTQIKEVIQEWLDNQVDTDFKRLTKLDVLGEEAETDVRIPTEKQAEVHKNYIYNDILATTQIMGLTSGDPAFYKPDGKDSKVTSRSIEYQKRNKQNVSPKQKMNVDAIYDLTDEQAKIEGTKQLTVNREYNTITINDEEIPSSLATQILNTLLANGISEVEAYQIAAQYGYSNTEDGKFAEVPSVETSIKPKQDLSTFTNHSGGAIGSDTAWDSIGKKYGMTSNKHYYFEGNKTPNGNTSIPINLVKEADNKLKSVNKVLGRKFPTSKEYVNNLLRRNWWQVKNSDAVFAISSITDNKVNGGTGWAVHMAINEGKPVYVFDQNKNKWFTWGNTTEKEGLFSKKGFIETNTPILTKNFAGIGTREINDNGRKAIENVYKKTSGEAATKSNIKFPTKEVNVTDAQSYITLPRYREIMIGLGRWNKTLQDLYPKLLDGTASGEDLKIVMQPIKPFYFGHHKENGLIIPYQVKNSEYLLLPQLVKDSPKLQKLYNYMMKEGEYSNRDGGLVHATNFISAVKVGSSNIIDNINNLDDTKFEDVNTVLDNNNYGLQQETPEHHVDTVSLMGSQIRKLIIGDISEDAEFNIGGKTLNKKDLVNLYQSIIVQDTKEAFKNISSKFEDINQVQQLILDEIRSRDLGDEYEKAFQLVERKNPLTGKTETTFNLPIYSPLTAKKSEAILNSVFKNNVVKQKIKGGPMVQLSSFGFTNDLNLNINEETGALESAECYMPWWSRKHFEPLLDKDGQLDISKIKDKSLLQMIGYRIPTEDKYSMLPLKVKGFLPASAGGAIMLPMEITTISGSDFDIDKLYLMMPEFETSLDGQDTRKVNYDYNKSPEGQSLMARNNAKLDIMWSILTNSDTFSKFIKPGGFDDLKKFANIVNILENTNDYSYDQLISKDLGELQELAAKYTPPIDLLNNGDKTKLFRNNMNGQSLRGIFVNHNNNHSILQYSNVALTEAILFNGEMRNQLNQQLNANDKLISGITSQFLAAVVDNAKDPVSAFINVNNYTADIAALLVRVGYPLETVTAFLSQPILKEFSNLYSNYGSNYQAEQKAIKELKERLQEAGLDYNRSGGVTNLNQSDLWKAISKKNVIDNYQMEILKAFLQISKQASSLGDLVRATRPDVVGPGPTLSKNESRLDLIDKVLKDQNLENQSELLYGNIIGPLVSGKSGSSHMPISNILNTYFPKGSEVEYFSDTSKQLEKGIIDDYNLGETFNGFDISGVSEPMSVLDLHSVNGKLISDLIDENSPYAMLSAFNEYGLKRPTEILSQWFPWLNKGFKEIKDEIQSNFPSRSLTPDEIDLINFDLLGYIASGFEFFNQEHRDTVLFNFPKMLEKFKEDHPDVVERNSFLKKLVITKATKKNGLPFDKLEFRNTGSMTNSERELYQQDWEDLINSPEFSIFGRNLVRYAYYTSGFHFTPNSFTHLIPTDFYANLVDSQNKKFVDYLTETMEETKYNSQVFDGFINQFYKNSTGRERAGFVPAVNSNKSNVTGNIVTVKGVPVVFRVDSNDINTTNEFIISKDKKFGAEFVPYVKYNVKGKTYLFEKQDSYDPFQATYVITNKLGLPNNMLELGIGIENSVPFTKNNPIANFKEADLAKMNQAIEVAKSTTSKSKVDDDVDTSFTDEQRDNNEEIKANCKKKSSNIVEGISKQTRRKR
jgi:hypothetical protein